MLRRERFDTIQVMADEAVKVAREGDPEVSEAIDFAKYYGSVGLDVLEQQRCRGCGAASARCCRRRVAVELPVRDPRGRRARRAGRRQRRRS